MREIKFRAWLDYGNGSGEMLPNVQNHINGKWAFGHIVNGSVDNASEPMQYTGLKDKNGVEIYDGDILKANGARDVHGATVKWFEYGWNLGAFHRLTESNIQSYKMVIIGNIHENPELVGEK